MRKIVNSNNIYGEHDKSARYYLLFCYSVKALGDNFRTPCRVQEAGFRNWNLAVSMIEDHGCGKWKRRVVEYIVLFHKRKGTVKTHSGKEMQVMTYGRERKCPRLGCLTNALGMGRVCSEARGARLRTESPWYSFGEGAVELAEGQKPG